MNGGKSKNQCSQQFLLFALHLEDQNDVLSVVIKLFERL
jgi:hypothetical protein